MWRNPPTELEFQITLHVFNHNYEESVPIRALFMHHIITVIHDHSQFAGLFYVFVIV